MSIFERTISDFFRGKSKLVVDKNGNPTSQDLRLAVAVLMVSLARQDGDFCPSEGKSISKKISTHFNIDDEEAVDLVEKAAPLSKNFDNIEEFVTSVNTSFSDEQKQLVLAMIWSIALADGVADRLETNFATVVRNRLNLSLEQAVSARQIAEDPEFDLSLAVATVTPMQ